MKHIRIITLFIWCALLTGCHPNTGHGISTKDRLEISRAHDWNVTWSLNTALANGGIKGRIKNPVWYYSIDSGPWKKKSFHVSRVSDTELRLEVTIDRAEFISGSEINCYMDYVFDGSSISRVSSPRLVKIN